MQELEKVQANIAYAILLPNGEIGGIKFEGQPEKDFKVGNNWHMHLAAARLNLIMSSARLCELLRKLTEALVLSSCFSPSFTNPVGRTA